MSSVVLQGNLVFPDRVIWGELAIREGKITAITTGPDEQIREDQLFISPGFIDLHLHGEEGALEEVASYHLRHGTTAFLMAVSSRDIEGYKKEFDALEKVRTDSERAPSTVLGCLFEGPFINPEMAGAQDAKHCVIPSGDMLEKILDLAHGQIKIMALAPELPGSAQIIHVLQERGIIPAIGHSNATYDETILSIENGISYAIHFGNRMGTFHHRNPGVLGAVLTDDRVSTGVIADGIHVHRAVLDLLFRSKKKGNAVLVSDYVSGNVTGKDGMLLGSRLSLDEALRNSIDWLQLDIAEALRLVTANPARLLGLESKGCLREGCDADLVTFDNEIRIQSVYIAGKKIVQ